MPVDELVINVRSIGIQALLGSLSNVRNSLAGVSRTAPKTAKGIEKIGESAKKSTKGLGAMLNSLKRIAVYRVLRTIIKEIAQEFEKGLENVYAFSSSINSSISQTLDSFASLRLVMSNQLGAALGELLTTIQPIVETIYRLITKLADAFSQLFAILGGRTTYHKATDGIAKWKEDTQDGAKAAKEWKNQLLGFDEINRLEAPSEMDNGSGSGGSNIGNWELTDVTMEFSKLKEFIEVTKGWAKSLNLEPIITAWKKLKDAVSGFSDVIWNGFMWVYKNVLLPFAKWRIEEFLPRAITLLADAFDFLSAVLEKVSPFLKKVVELMKEFAKFIGDKLLRALDWLSGELESLTAKVENAKSFGEFLKSLDGKDIVFLAIASAIAAVVISMSSFNVTSLIVGVAIAALVAGGIWLYSHWETVKKKADELKGKILFVWESIKEGWHTAGQSLKEDWEIVKTFISEKIDALREKWENFKNDISKICENIRGFFEDLRKKWESVKEDISDKIDSVHEKWEDMKEKAGELRDRVAEAFESLKSKLQAPIETIRGWIQGISDACSRAVSWLQSVFGWQNKVNAQGTTIHASSSSVSHGGSTAQFASGGFPTAGELFIANEVTNSPELVGTIGGHTAVANNDQIVAAVSQGVASAVASVMGNMNSGGGSVTLNVNGKQFCRAIYNDLKSVTNEHGISLVNA